jgi:hypothetical protein
VRGRLQQLYPGDHRFTVERATSGGTRVVVDIPRRIEPAIGPALRLTGTAS